MRTYTLFTIVLMLCAFIAFVVLAILLAATGIGAYTNEDGNRSLAIQVILIIAVAVIAAYLVVTFTFDLSQHRDNAFRLRTQWVATALACLFFAVFVALYLYFFRAWGDWTNDDGDRLDANGVGLALWWLIISMFGLGGLWLLAFLAIGLQTALPATLKKFKRGRKRRGDDAWKQLYRPT